MIIPLELRNIKIKTECDQTPCGEKCLLRESHLFSYAIPEGMGKNRQPSHLTQALFKTKQNTIIKRRKHFFGVRVNSFGLSYPFDRLQQQKAFDTLRLAKPEGISLPLRECQCSYETQFAPGKLACPKDSMYAPQLGQKYELHHFNSPSEALSFVKNAWQILCQLHQIGLQHGDPTHYNFIVSGSQVTLIDLDDLMQIEGIFSPWDFSIFFLYTLIPVMREHFSADSIGEILPAVFGSTINQVSTFTPLFTTLAGLVFLPVTQFHQLTRYKASQEIENQARQLHHEDLTNRFNEMQTQQVYLREKLAQAAMEVESRGKGSLGIIRATGYELRVRG